MTARQSSLFQREPRKRVWRMHVTDVRNDEPCSVELTCKRCGCETRWISFPTVTEAKRGLPCPRCNA